MANSFQFTRPTSLSLAHRNDINLCMSFLLLYASATSLGFLAVQAAKSVEGHRERSRRAPQDDMNYKIIFMRCGACAQAWAITQRMGL